MLPLTLGDFMLEVGKFQKDELYIYTYFVFLGRY
jgi:hypothetical protein